MHKLMCTFVTAMKKKKIPDRNLDTSCPAGIPCNKDTFVRFLTVQEKQIIARTIGIQRLCIFQR